jgi:hypothetical protein
MQDFPELAVEAEKFINQWYKSESANANGENPSTGTKPPIGPEPYSGKAPNLSNKQISDMQNIIDKSPDDNAAIGGLTDYLHKQGLSKEEIKEIIKKIR